MSITVILLPAVPASVHRTSFGDKWGRANMVVIGLLINGIFAVWAVPDASNKTTGP